MNQEILRKQVKLAKALNDDWTYKMMSEAIGITDHAFYNWLKGYYSLSYSKARYLEDIIICLID